MEMLKKIYVVDKNFGMLFNKRRQSKDSVLIEDIVKKVQASNGSLWLSDYSKELFEGKDIPMKNILELNNNAEEEDFLFIEDVDVENFTEEVEFHIYKWDKVYPADKKFEFPLPSSYEIKEETTFVGSSHENIESYVLNVEIKN